MKEDILKFNEDVLPAVYASCKYGVHGLGEENLMKTLSFLTIADIHGCKERLESALCYLDNIPSLDFGVHLGDMQPGNFTENDGTWYTVPVLNAKKILYSVIGNHDGGNNTDATLVGTKQEVFDKFLRPLKDKMDMPELDKTYYSVNFDKYKVSMIVLDNYMGLDDRDENGNLIYHSGTECYNQEQIDWLVKTLKEIPKDYHLIVLMHSFIEENVIKKCVFSQEGARLVGESNMAYCKQEMITSIIDAWMNGVKLNKEFLPEKGFEKFLSIKVDADFSSRGEGVFVGYFIGHTHWDLIATSKAYPKQNIFVFASAADDLWQNRCTDLPRAKGTKQEDLLTVCSIDTESRQVKLVRVGSNITIDLVERKYFVCKY